jgi:glutamate---cysteine ligase / carboxylate-amine ligase
LTVGDAGYIQAAVRGGPVTVGVEEEYQLVDSETRALVAIAPRIVLRAENRDLDVKEELHSSQIEIGTRICASLAEVRAEIAAARRSVGVMAAARGARPVAGGTHPFSRWEHQPVTDSPHYEELEESYRQIVRETVIFGSHVHVGVDDPEELIGVMNRARLRIPVLIAVAANSPFWGGSDTGYASFRAEIARRWPQSDLPHHFDSRAEYDKLIADLVAGGTVPDASEIYWDLRPSMRYDTLEFRATDVPPSIDETVMVAGLARALVLTCLDEIDRDTATPVPRPELW